MYPNSITLHTPKVSKFSVTVALLDFEHFVTAREFLNLFKILEN